MKKHHWHAFWHEKLFEKHPQPHCQTCSNWGQSKEFPQIYLLIQNKEYEAVTSSIIL